MVPRDEADHFGFVRLEPAQLAVANQVVRVFVVSLVADVDPDVVQDGRVLEQLPLAIRESMDRARLIEQRDGQAGDMLCVFRPEVAPLREFEDASSPHVWVPVGLRDLLPVARDEVEHQPFAQ